MTKPSLLIMDLQHFADIELPEEVDFLLPDDYVEDEEVEETEEETETDDQSDEAEETEETTEETEVEEVATQDDILELELKWLDDVKKLKDIPKDELKTYVQKGMDYDRKVTKLNEARLALDRVDELAKNYGMSQEQLINTLFDSYFEQTADSKGLTKEIVKKEYELNNPRKAREQKAIESFVKAFPDVKPADIPAEVWEQYKDGTDLKVAYESHLSKSEASRLKQEIETLKQQLKLKDQVEKTKKKSVVKPITENEKEQKTDDFLSGLLGLD